MDKQNGTYNLTVFLYTEDKIIHQTDWSKHDVKQSLFGEELLLKKIGDINFIVTNKFDSTLLTADEVRRRLIK